MTGDGRYRGPDDELRSVFEGLKQRGPQILVTGDVPEGVSRRATRRLLGHPSERRRRILALTDSDAPADRWLPSTVDETDDRVAVVRDRTLRGAAAARAPTNDDDDSLAAKVEAEIAAWVDEDSPPKPSVLRVGVYSLESLLETNGVEAVRSLTYRLTGTVRRARGMGHYHLPRGPESQAVEDLRYVFDAHLELRESGAGAKQRWHIPGRGTTRWVALDEQQ